MKNTFAKVAAGLFLLFVLVTFSDTAHATIVPVPEVDASSTGAALVLLVGSYLVVVSKFRRK